MKYFFSVFFFLALLSGSGLAQERNKPRVNGFFFVAPGVRNDTGSSTFGVGGGAEYYVYKGVGFGLDLGAINTASTTGVRHWTAMMSLNAIYNFNINDKSKVSPFIIGGASIAGFDVPGGVNFGGGIQYWFHEHIGLRVEFRDHIFIGMNDHHYPQGRIGIAFRP